MPIAWEIRKTPGGMPYSRSVAKGRITMEDVLQLKQVSSPGGALYGLSTVTVNEPDMSLEPDARRAFADMLEQSPNTFLALVVPSAPMRVMMTFVMRMSGKADTTKLFGDEASATKWIFENVDKR